MSQDCLREQHEPRTPTVWTWVLLATVPITWGFNFITLKVIKADFGVAGPLEGVYGMLSARYVLMVVALMLTLWVVERDLSIRREHWRYLIGFTLIGVVVYQGTFTAGVLYTMAAEGALLISTAPIWAALITHILGWERLTGRQAVGTILGFVGITGVVFGGLKAANAPEHHVAGIIVMVIAGILWGAYAVFCKPLLKHYSPLKVTAWIHTLGAVILIPLGARAAMQVDWAGMSLISWVSLIHFSLIAGVYAFVVWYEGVAAIGASRTVAFQYCVPLVATILAYFIFDEEPTVLQIVGIFVTLVGVSLAVRHGPRRDHAEPQTPEEVEEDIELSLSAAAPSGE